MPDFSLVPVEYPPNFEEVSHVPVEHDPFSDDVGTQQAQAQQAQTQVPQPTDQPQQPPAEVARLYVGRPANNTNASPVLSNDERIRLYGELKTWTPTPTQQIGNLAADGLMALGMKPYEAHDWATRLGNLLGLIPPVGVGGSALDLIDAKRRDDFPGAVTAALGMIPGSRGIARGVAEEAGAGLGALLRRSPASRAAEKGFLGIGTTPNGGPTFARSDHLYPAGPEQRSVFKMPLTGSRRADRKLANKMGGFTETPTGYVWHHVDDFDPQTGMSSMELVKESAHQASSPNSGSVSQWAKYHGRPYRR